MLLEEGEKKNKNERIEMCCMYLFNFFSLYIE